MRPSYDPRPIGVFDSGVGGLTVVSALRHRLPHESILYLGDTARLPYGTKSPSTVIRYSRKNIAFLVERDVKAVVIACNTASAVTMDHVHQPDQPPSDQPRPDQPPAYDDALARGLDDLEFPVPVWGVIEPGAAAAVAQATAHIGHTGREPSPIGVLATESTIQSQAYGRAIRRLEPRARVIAQACPLFVPLVEDDWCDDPVAEQVARRYLQPVLDAGVCTLVLGCTHYPLLEPVIQRIAGPDVVCVDSARTAAEKVAAELTRLGLAARGDATPDLHLCVTDRGERFQRIAERLLRPAGEARSQKISLEWVDV